MTPFLRALYLEFFPPCLDALESYLILCTLNIFVNLTLFVVQIDKKKKENRKIGPLTFSWKQQHTLELHVC